ncbi:hypothetical protein [Catellatospora tritici]|uniref:hypothetical protein n=1 Tax=Catellatospora tritici TaxID=2851566 RepID=UPI001C2D3AEB|nr:hypothetical protein [Catellatospora tritici]
MEGTYVGIVRRLDAGLPAIRPFPPVSAHQKTGEPTMSVDVRQHSQNGSEVSEKVQTLEKEQAVQAATQAGAQATQAATMTGAQAAQMATQAGQAAATGASIAGLAAAVASGAAGLIIGIFLGMSIVRGRAETWR